MALASPTTIEPQETLTNCYVLWFRMPSGPNQLMSKNFRCPGGLKAAIERGTRHCEIMNYKIHFVQPLVSDLNREETFKLGKETFA